MNMNQWGERVIKYENEIAQKQLCCFNQYGMKINETVINIRT